MSHIIKKYLVWYIVITFVKEKVSRYLSIKLHSCRAVHHRLLIRLLILSEPNGHPILWWYIIAYRQIQYVSLHNLIDNMMI